MHRTSTDRYVLNEVQCKGRALALWDGAAAAAAARCYRCFCTGGRVQMKPPCRLVKMERRLQARTARPGFIHFRIDEARLVRSNLGGQGGQCELRRTWRGCVRRALRSPSPGPEEVFIA